MPTGFADKEAENFKKKARKILTRTDEGKSLLRLLEEAPRPPRMRGLPKVHKAGVPMRPITSGIGSAPHRLAKVLAKPLSASLGVMSNAHLRNSSDLIQRLQQVSFDGKKMASFDIKSLFTNVPVEGAISAVKKAVEDVNDSDLCLNKVDYLELVQLCVNFGAFVFEGQEYVQHRGLAMGSPLSAVMASLYMEMLEKDEFVRIMGRNSEWFRYVDDVLVVVPRNVNIENKLRMLNRVNEYIQFTVELEVDNKLPFLDTVIHRCDNSVKFSVYRKPTNKDDFIHYLSAHSEKVKSGVVIGFYLRALRICSEEFLEDEIAYVTAAFLKLSYPLALLRRLKKKSVEISKRKNEEKVNKECLVVPYTRGVEVITKVLSDAGIRVAYASGQSIQTIVRGGGSRGKNKLSVVYSIPCGGCPASYYGETARGMEKRMKEHKSDLRHHRTTNSLVLHAEEFDHLPDWEHVEALHTGLNKRKRKLVEAAYIATGKTTNHREGFMNLSHAAAKLVLSSQSPRFPLLRRPHR